MQTSADDADDTARILEAVEAMVKRVAPMLDELAELRQLVAALKEQNANLVTALRLRDGIDLEEPADDLPPMLN
jgi:hypothetical protein